MKTKRYQVYLKEVEIPAKSVHFQLPGIVRRKSKVCNFQIK
jgi:hypothetical protein